MGYEFSTITGTSIGAINGAFLAMNKFDEIYSIWQEGEVNKLIETDKEMLGKVLDLKFSGENITDIFDYILKIIDEGGLNITPLKNLLRKHIDEKELRDSKIELGLVTISFTDFKPIEIFIEDIPKGKVIDYIIASASLPIFKLEKLDGKTFLDGGFYDNVPINLITKKNVKDIIVVETNGIGRRKKFDDRDLNIIRIKPSKKISRILEVDPRVMRRNLEIGYLDAYKTINKYHGNNYYIKIEENEKYFINKIANLDKKKIKDIYKLFNYEGKINKRNLIERVIPILGNVLKIGDDYSYIDLFLNLNEEIAKYYNISNMKIYTYSEFNKIIVESFDFEKNGLISSKYKLIPFKLLPKQVELLPKKVREKILLEFFRIFYS